MKPAHGGKRAGAGRPALGGETITIYINGWRKAALEERAAKNGHSWKIELLLSLDRECGLT